MGNKIMDIRIKKLLGSAYRKRMWKETEKIINKLKKSVPISSIYLIGSFTTKKRRPADVDLIVFLKTKEKELSTKWSVDLAIAPDNRYGDYVLSDARKWMKQKYGSKKSAVIQLWKN
jgi:predicted nucleotidyltransferase